MMENAEEILHCLDEYTKVKPKDIPRELEDYLCFVARTGDPVYQWSLIKTLFREKLLNVITDFYETCPTVEIPPCPNVETFNYEVMKTFILEKLESFASAPFTVQRICELLTSPRKEYNRIDKYMRALEKNILVVSTREPGSRRSTENGDDTSMLNGLENDSTPSVLGNDGHIEVDMEEAPIWSPKSAELKNIPQAEEEISGKPEVNSEEKSELPLLSETTETAEAVHTDDIRAIEPETSEETAQPSAEIPEMEIAASEVFTATAEASPTDIFIEQAKLENEDETAGQETYFSIISAEVPPEAAEVILPVIAEENKVKEMVIDKNPDEEIKEESIPPPPVEKDEKELMEAMTLEKETVESKTEEIKVFEPEPVEEVPEMEVVNEVIEEPKTEIEVPIEPVVEIPIETVVDIPKEIEEPNVEKLEEAAVQKEESQEELPKVESSEVATEEEEEKSVENVPEDSPKIEVSPPESEESSSSSIPPSDETSQ